MWRSLAAPTRTVMGETTALGHAVRFGPIASNFAFCSSLRVA